MQKEDLLQIKELLDSSIGDFRQEMKESFASNNAELRKEIKESNDELRKELVERMDSMEENIMTLSKIEFNKIEDRFDEVDKELAKRSTLDQIMSWGDKKVVPLERDVEKIKYLHIEEFKELPSNFEISQKLAEEGLV